MKRLLLVLFLFCVGNVPLFSKPVSSQTAAAVARNWMAAVNGIDAKAIAVREVVPLTPDLPTRIYCCNLLPEGFVLVAGDDVCIPVLMYSKEGRFGDTPPPPGLTQFLEGARAEISWAIEHALEGSAETTLRWTELISPSRSLPHTAATSVSPLLTSTWNQSFPYNNLCPTDPKGPNGHTYTGCVATAMAQIMRFHGWPAKGVGSHSYSSASYGTLSADFGATQYAWELMPDALGTGGPPASVTATATLMLHCGIAVDMNYGPASSGAQMPKVRTAFANYFMYDPQVSYVRRDDFTPSSWLSMLKDNLDHSMPVLYSGFDNTAGSGHAYVLDGYDAANYFHVNWGWGGSYNGYFAIDALTPGSMKFNSQHDAIINIKPLAWVSQSAGTMRNLLAVKAVDTLVVWICGEGGTVLRSSDAGATWKKAVFPDTAFTLCSIDVVSASVAWVAGTKGLGGDAGVWKTADAGATWTRQITFQQLTSRIRSVRFFDDSHGIAVGDPLAGEYSLWTTSDGGTVWSSIPGDALPDATGGEFSSGNGLCIAGNNAWFGTGERNTGLVRVLRSFDRGLTWQSSGILPGLGNTLASTCFATTSLGWTLGSNGSVASSTDGGLNWSPAVPSGASKGLAIAYIGGPVSAVVGSYGDFLVTRDNGSAWDAQLKGPTSKTLNSLAFPTPSVGWIVGEGGTILRWIGTPFYVPPPVVPVLSAPANAASNVTVSPDLAWLASSRALTYTFEVATDAGFKNLFLRKSGIRGTSSKLLNLNTKMTYYWRVRSQNSGGESGWSDVWSFTTVASLPAIPKLSWPPTLSLALPVQTTLRWKPANEATSYRLHVYSLALGIPSTVLDLAGITDTVYQVIGLEYSTKYFWEVKGVNAGGESLWSETWNFTTVPQPPSNVTLVSPAQMAGNVSVSPELVWSAGDRATLFQVQLSTDVSFGTIVFDNDSILASPLIITPPLQNATKYFWRVRARNAGGSSPWSSIWYFITADAPPPAPAQIAPADSAREQGVSLLFQWGAVAKAALYHLQISGDRSFATTLRDSAAVKREECRINGLEYAKIYYWRVRASSATVFGAWSPVRMFETSIAPPPPPALSTPSDNASNSDTAVTLSWQASAGAASYHVQVSLGINFATTVCDTAGLTMPTFALHALRTTTQYFWRVEAVNSSGRSGWSAISRFTTRASTTDAESNLPDVARSISLSQNYPNPVAGLTIISYKLARGGHVSLSLYNALGQRVSVLVDAERSAGVHAARLNTDDLPAGTYLYVLTTESAAAARTLLLIK